MTTQVDKQKKLVDHRNSEIQKVCEILLIEEPVAIMLCEHFKWNMDRLFERCPDQDSIPQILGDTSSRKEVKEIGSGLCSICMVDCDNLVGLSVCPETHHFCQDCWRNYIGAKLTEGVIQVKCMAGGCKNILNDAFCRSVLEKEYEKMERMKLDFYLKQNRRITICPACKLIVELNPDSDTVQCSCSFKLCTTCGQENHSPIDCGTLRVWGLVCETFRKTNLIHVKEGQESEVIFTQQCPNRACQVVIVKDGGCKFVNCRMCQTPFCWACQTQLTKDHQEHNCVPASSAQVQYDEDFRNCYQSYINHDKELKILRLTPPLRFKAEERRKALEILIESENILKNAKIHSFFTQNGIVNYLIETLQENVKSIKQQLFVHPSKSSNLSLDKAVKITLGNSQSLIRNVEESNENYLRLNKV